MPSEKEDLYDKLCALTAAFDGSLSDIGWVASYQPKDYFMFFFDTFPNNESYDDYISKKKVIYVISNILAYDTFIPRINADDRKEFLVRLLDSDEYRISLSTEIIPEWIHANPSIIREFQGDLLFQILDLTHYTSSSNLLFILMTRDVYSDDQKTTLYRDDPPLLFFMIYKYILSLKLPIRNKGNNSSNNSIEYDTIKSQIFSFQVLINDFFQRIFKEMFSDQYHPIIDYYYAFFDQSNVNVLFEIINLCDVRSIIGITILSNLLTCEFENDSNRMQKQGVDTLKDSNKEVVLRLLTSLLFNLNRINWKEYTAKLFDSDDCFLPYLVISYLNFIFVCKKNTYITELSELFSEDLIQNTMSSFLNGKFQGRSSHIILCMFAEIKSYEKVSDKYEFKPSLRHLEGKYEIEQPPDYSTYFKTFHNNYDLFEKMYAKSRQNSTQSKIVVINQKRK